MREAGGRGLLGRLRRVEAGAWREAADAVPLDDAAAGAELAREAATPFGYKRPAGELLARFGGEGREARRRATAALALAGVVADPPLADAAPHQFVQLRRAEAAPAPSAASPASAAAASASAAAAFAPPAAAFAPPAAASASPPAAASASPPAAAPAPSAAAPAPPAAAPAPPETERARPTLGELLRAGYRIRRHPAATGTRSSVPTDRRVRAGALGLGALAVLMVAAVLLRGFAGDGGETASALPSDDAPAAQTTATTSAKPPARSATTSAEPPARSATAPAKPRTSAPAKPRTSAPAEPRTSAPAKPSTTAPAGTGSAPPPRGRPAGVRLRIVPTAPAYVCVADGRGATLYEGMLARPYAVRRERLILRVGTATARIDANGRPVRVTSAPGAFELTPGATRPLPGDALVCGAG